MQMGELLGGLLIPLRVLACVAAEMCLLMLSSCQELEHGQPSATTRFRTQGVGGTRVCVWGGDTMWQVRKGRGRLSS
jgi:hypothetical protein